VSAAVSFGLILPLGIKLVRPDLKMFGLIVFMGITDTAGYVAFDAGILSAGNSLPIVVTLSSLVGVLTLILARAFYKEKVNALQWVGIAAITIGVLVVLYF
jgi:uncharacterized membrane protein